MRLNFMEFIVYHFKKSYLKTGTVIVFEYVGDKKKISKISPCKMTVSKGVLPLHFRLQDSPIKADGFIQI